MSGHSKWHNIQAKKSKTDAWGAGGRSAPGSKLCKAGGAGDADSGSAEGEARGGGRAFL